MDRRLGQEGFMVTDEYAGGSAGGSKAVLCVAPSIAGSVVSEPKESRRSGVWVISRGGSTIVGLFSAIS